MRFAHQLSPASEDPALVTDARTRTLSAPSRFSAGCITNISSRRHVLDWFIADYSRVRVFRILRPPVATINGPIPAIAARNHTRSEPILFSAGCITNIFSRPPALDWVFADYRTPELLQLRSGMMNRESGHYGPLVACDLSYPYAIYYLPTEHELVIVRVLHGARDSAATNALVHDADIANVATTRICDRRKSKPEVSPTFNSPPTRSGIGAFWIEDTGQN